MSTLLNRHWQAKWIWDNGEAKPTNFFLMARRNFEISSRPDSAVIHITASDRYRLFINGNYVGRGPARSDPRWKSFDSYNVIDYLNTGKNAIAVLSYHYGPPVTARGPVHEYRGNYYACGERAGLWAQLEMGDEIIATDTNWRVRQAQGWLRGSRPMLAYTGYPEWFDARKDPLDWMVTSFDDSAWLPATLVPHREREWLIMESRDVPMMREREIFPAHIVRNGEVIEQRAEVGQLSDIMAKEIHLPLEYAVLEHPEALIAGDDRCTRAQARYVRGYGIRNPFLIIDFGRQVFGFPRLRLNAPAGCVIDMTYGQQLVGGRIPLANYSLANGDRYITREGKQVWEVFEYKQFRYLHIAFRSRKPVEVQSVSLNAYEYPAQQRGRFECSDELLTKVWQACVDTVYLTMEDVLCLDAFRERDNWSVSDLPQGIYAAFGDADVLKRHHRLISRSDRGEGLLAILYPPDFSVNKTPEPVSGFFWLINIEEYYRYVGDQHLLEEIYPAIKRQINWFTFLADEDGMLTDIPGINTGDEASNDLRGTNFLANGFYLIVLEACARLADVVHDVASATLWRERAGRVRQFLRSRFWNEEKGLFEDSLYHGKLTGIVSELANGIALLSGVATEKQIPRIVSQFMQETPAGMVEASPIVLRLVLFGLAGAGYLEHALEVIRGKYRQMVEMFEHPTIWEVWDRFTCPHRITTDLEFELYAKRPAEEIDISVDSNACLSLAHSGTSPALLLSQEVLGVKGVGNGFQECRIEVPELQTISWARGIFPSVRGDIEVEWRKVDKNLTLRVQLPSNLKTTLVVPGEARAIILNGKPIKQHSIAVSGGEHHVEWMS